MVKKKLSEAKRQKVPIFSGFQQIGGKEDIQRLQLYHGKRNKEPWVLC